MTGYRIVTSAEKSATVAEAWRKQYQSGNGAWKDCQKGPGEAIYKAIVAANGDPEKIATAIGNKSWSHLHCSVCEEYRHMVIQVSRYEEPANVCQQCLMSMTATFEAVMKYVGSRP